MVKKIFSPGIALLVASTALLCACNNDDDNKQVRLGTIPGLK